MVSPAVNEIPSTVQIWLAAARPHTLTASLCPCLVAAAATRSPWHCQLLWTTFCLTVQLGTNLHNDYSDYVQGADTANRIGQPRATARGWLTPFQTCAAACASLTITTLSGVLLAWQTQQLDNMIVWFWMGTSIFNAFAYTAGPFPLGYIGLGNCSIAYAGLGDIFVLVYFGYVAVLMLPYLLENETDWTAQWIYGTQVGLLATNIIVVNNLRDRHTDVQAHKRTTAVRFGRGFSLVEYVGLPRRDVRAGGDGCIPRRLCGATLAAPERPGGPFTSRGRFWQGRGGTQSACGRSR